MSSIPTTYNGIRFRSRLEAKWAAYFDQITRYDNRDWFKDEWLYEPFDLNGWIPDFLHETEIFGAELIEVKPVVHLEEFTNSKDWTKVSKALEDAEFYTSKRFANFRLCGVSWRHTWLYYPTKHWIYAVDDLFKPGNSVSKPFEDRWARACNAAQWKAPA
jgi:hypothetical protein